MSFAHAEGTASLEEIFAHPPAAARPWVFWYWMQGAVSRAGITADLVAMKQAGLAGAYLMPINGPATPPVFTPVVNQLSPEWWAMVRHAATEADRLGLKLAMAASDGFATAGGPWITPELSMQKIVWSEIHLTGGKSFSASLPLPPTQENYYRDIAVLAFPTPTGGNVSVAPKISTNIPGLDVQFLTGGDLQQQFRSDQPCWLQYEYPAPFALRSVVVRQWGKNFNGVYHATRLSLEASDDGKAFWPVTQLVPPRHGWQDWDADYTFGVAPVTARFFRFIYTPDGAEPGSEDLNGAKWKTRLVLRGLELSSAPRIPGFEGKSGAVWRRSERSTATGLPDALCVPRAAIVDLTAKLTSQGRLDWNPPSGQWTILRLGHTSTGHRNETGGTGQGLECDKFNPVAVRAQFAGWFGEATKQLGPDLCGRVLKLFHVDSWEAGSQNWSPVFADEFQRRRGYNPTALLPVFAGIPVGSADTSERFLADVRQTIADLIAENFFGTLADLAHAQGCEFSSESTAPTMMDDGLRHFHRVDVPMGEFWLRSPRHDKPNDILDAISGAHIYGKNIVQAEAFTELRVLWDEHPAMMKPLADHEFALGVNRLVLHVFAHNPWLDRRPGMTLNGVGTYLQRDQTWWADAGAWIDYLSRCSALLQIGNSVVDVAYFTGEELPSRAVLPARRAIALPAGYTADSINADALLRLGKVDKGRLVLTGGARYAALVIPTDDSAPRSPALAAKLSELGNLVVDVGGSLAARLGRANVSPDFLVKENDEPAAQIEWTHRHAADAEIYFVVNALDTKRSLRLSLRFSGVEPQIWNPLTGDISGAAEFHESDGRAIIALKLEPRGTRFIVFPRPTHAPQNKVKPEATLIETRTLHGPWQVSFDPKNGGPNEAVTFAALSDWTTQADERIRYYSGTGIYAQQFEWKPARDGLRVWLDLGSVANLARVLINDVDCGVAWTPPYRVEITHALRAGTNEISFRVTNTWANRVVGDRDLKPEDRITWTTAPASNDTHLLPAGLLGPVRLFTDEAERVAPARSEIRRVFPSHVNREAQ